jgi:hypothetical protein
VCARAPARLRRRRARAAQAELALEAQRAHAELRLREAEARAAEISAKRALAEEQAAALGKSVTLVAMKQKATKAKLQEAEDARALASTALDEAMGEVRARAGCALGCLLCCVRARARVVAPAAMRAGCVRGRWLRPPPLLGDAPPPLPRGAAARYHASAAPHVPVPSCTRVCMRACARVCVPCPACSPRFALARAPGACARTFCAACAIQVHSMATELSMLHSSVRVQMTVMGEALEHRDAVATLVQVTSRSIAWLALARTDALRARSRARGRAALLLSGQCSQPRRFELGSCLSSSAAR